MSVKLMMFGRRRPGQSLAEHRVHMKDVHGRYVLDYMAADPEHAPRRYVQNHAFDGIYPGGEGPVKAFGLGLDFVTEIWFPDLASLKASQQTQFYRERLQPDEPLMVDSTTVVGLPVLEEIVRAPVTRPGDYVKVFLAWHGRTPANAELVAALGVVAQGTEGHCRNIPAVPAPLLAIDEFWLSDNDRALDFAQACRDTILRSQQPEPGNFTITLAREHVFHAR